MCNSCNRHVRALRAHSKRLLGALQAIVSGAALRNDLAAISRCHLPDDIPEVADICERHSDNSVFLDGVGKLLLCHSPLVVRLRWPVLGLECYLPKRMLGLDESTQRQVGAATWARGGAALC